MTSERLTRLWIQDVKAGNDQQPEYQGVKWTAILDVDRLPYGNQIC